RNRNFDVDVRTPRPDLQSLALHLRELIREDLKRNRKILNLGQNRTRELFIVPDAGLRHQCRVCGESLDETLTIAFQHLVPICSVGVNGNVQFWVFHIFAKVPVRTYSPKSASPAGDPTSKNRVVISSPARVPRRLNTLKTSPRSITSSDGISVSTTERRNAIKP